jgi:hypothetical protein
MNNTRRTDKLLKETVTDIEVSKVEYSTFAEESQTVRTNVLGDTRDVVKGVLV